MLMVKKKHISGNANLSHDRSWYVFDRRRFIDPREDWTDRREREEMRFSGKTNKEKRKTKSTIQEEKMEICRRRKREEKTKEMRKRIKIEKQKDTEKNCNHWMQLHQRLLIVIHVFSFWPIRTHINVLVLA